MTVFKERQPVTLLTTLGIEVVEASKERVVARMPVGPKVWQPFGILHGGASVALAETVASTGAWMNVDQEKERVVGVEINANHLRAKSDGELTATGTRVQEARQALLAYQTEHNLVSPRAQVETVSSNVARLEGECFWPRRFFLGRRHGFMAETARLLPK